MIVARDSGIGQLPQAADAVDRRLGAAELLGEPAGSIGPEDACYIFPKAAQILL